jgi:REP element-mobilizing transposase RayT
MPNHVHALLRPLPGFALEDILHSVKSFSAQAINRVLGRTGTLWQEESYDHIVRDERSLRQIQAYIRDNPVKARLKEGTYLLASADYDIP